ncbi:extracellular solute-binding protein [Clostridium swellfunianum]|uniref:extracellular solute-binding protein n=1 Tax=Clostridium swellfunianum TaxID=1367462 RepID=UPI00202F2054|nr:extracellular solute-binding protein [Clostridium swellfunianum]MCM0649608.1 extracellular solute-binding protein [Clostridium swellfunianum]
MNKKLRSIVTTVVMLSLSASLLAGCGKKDTASSSKATSGQTGEISYPIKTDVTLKYWLPLNANVSATRKNLGETEFAKELQKQTGVKVDYIHPAQGQEKEKFNLLLASGDLPDLIESEWGAFPGGPDKAIKDGSILKLNDYIDKYAPNLKKFLKDHPEIDKACKTDTGAYYMFPFIRSDDLLTVYYGPTMREDWLKELNLPVPTTMDEWEIVLKAFKEKKGATAPLSFELREIFGAFAGAYGVTYGNGVGNGYYVDNGKVKFGPMEQGFKDFVSTFNRWYKDGLLDKNFATVDKKIKASNMLSGKSGATLAYSGGDIGNWINAMKDKDPNFKLVGVPYPSAVKGQKAATGQKQFLSTGQGVAISAKSKNIEQAIRFLDYGYSKAGMDIYNFGIKDVSYKMVDGKPVYTDLIIKNPEKLSLAQAMSIYMRTYSGPFVQVKEYIDNYYQLPLQKEAIKAWVNTDAPKTMIPYVTALPEESSELSKMENEISTYVDEMFLKFVMGQEPISNFDKYTSQIQKMDIDKVLKIKQSALERYNKR